MAAATSGQVELEVPANVVEAAAVADDKISADTMAALTKPALDKMACLIFDILHLLV